MNRAGVSPVRTEKFTVDVAGVPAHIFVLGYADRIMVVVSQVGTLGTIVHARKETALGIGGGSTYRTDTLLGPRDDPVAELCARQLAEKLSGMGCELPVLLCLGLRRPVPGIAAAGGTAAVLAIVDAVTAHPVW